MKKIVLTLGAVLTFGIASAQVPPSQPQQTQPDPITTKKDAETKAKKDANVQNDVLAPTEAQQRKDELKTRNHVKSTPSPSITKDTINSKKNKTTVRPKRKQ